MRHTLLSVACIFCALASTSTADFSARDKAIETNGIRVEFNNISNTGRVHVYQCEQCKKSNYAFTQKPHIMRKGKTISFHAGFLERQVPHLNTRP